MVINIHILFHNEKFGNDSTCQILSFNAKWATSAMLKSIFDICYSVSHVMVVLDGSAGARTGLHVSDNTANNKQ